MIGSLVSRWSGTARIMALLLLTGAISTTNGIARQDGDGEGQIGACYATSDKACYSSRMDAEPEGCNSLCTDLCGGAPKSQASPTCGNAGACDPECGWEEACAWRTCSCNRALE